MATVTVRKGDTEFQIHDLTLDELRALIGVNGNGNGHIAPAAPTPRKKRVPENESTVSREQTSDTDIHGFVANMSARERTFISTLRNHPAGIEANALAALLQLTDARQLGGFAGGGLSKTAKKFRIKLRDIYRSDVTFPAGKRTRTFYPGKLIKSGAI